MFQLVIPVILRKKECFHVSTRDPNYYLYRLDQLQKGVRWVVDFTVNSLELLNHYRSMVSLLHRYHFGRS